MALSTSCSRCRSRPTGMSTHHRVGHADAGIKRWVTLRCTSSPWEASGPGAHDRVKTRLVDPREPWLHAIGISDHQGEQTPAGRGNTAAEEFSYASSPLPSKTCPPPSIRVRCADRLREPTPKLRGRPGLWERLPRRLLPIVTRVLDPSGCSVAMSESITSSSLGTATRHRPRNRAGRVAPP